MKLIKQSYSERKPRDFWITHVDAFQASKLSMSEYGKKHNLVNSQFSYWYYKLKKEINNKNPVPNQSHFIPIKMIEHIDKTSHHQSAPEIIGTVEFDGSKRLHLYTECAMENVIKLLLR